MTRTVDAYGTTVRRYGQGEILTAGTPTLPLELAYQGLTGEWLERIGEKAKPAAPNNRALSGAPRNRAKR